MSGYEVTLRQTDGETETLARYPDHADAKRHLTNYCRWDDGSWNVENGDQIAESDDGRRLTISPISVYRAYHPGNVDTDPRHGFLDWQEKIRGSEGLHIIPCEHSEPDALDIRIRANSYAVILDEESTLEDYLEEYERGEIDVPKYYSRIPDDTDDAILEGPPRAGSNEAGTLVCGQHVETSIRILTGGGHYSASEFTIHDCLPKPCIISRDDVGHVIFAPRVRRTPGDSQSSRSAEA